MNPITLSKNIIIEFNGLKMMAHTSAYINLISFASFDESVYPPSDESFFSLFLFFSNNNN